MPRTKSEGGPGAGRQPARERIVAGARRHFFAHGFRGVTMDDLAAELGMSKKTLYAHFPSKPVLVEAAIDAKFAQLEAELGRPEAGRGAAFPDALRELLACVQRHTEEVSPAFLRDVQRSDPELFAKVEARRTAVIQRYFGKLFADGRRAGMVRKDLAPELVIRALLGAVRAVVNPATLAELGMTPQAAFPAILSVVLHGVLTPAGRAGR
jgi:AcrR family transcriptional regulator